MESFSANAKNINQKLKFCGSYHSLGQLLLFKEYICKNLKLKTSYVLYWFILLKQQHRRIQTFLRGGWGIAKLGNELFLLIVYKLNVLFCSEN